MLQHFQVASINNKVEYIPAIDNILLVQDGNNHA